MTEPSVRNDERRLKLIIATLVAPLVTVPTLLALSLPFTGTGATGLVEGAKGVLHASFFLAFFGLPVAYAVEGLLILTTLLIGGTPSTVAPRAVILWATLSGAVTMFFVWVTFIGGEDPWTILLGAGMGLASGATFIFLRDGSSGIRALLPTRDQEPSGSTSRAGA